MVLVSSVFKSFIIGFDHSPDILNGIKVGGVWRELKKFAPSSLNEFPRFTAFMEGSVIRHNGLAFFQARHQTSTH